MDFDISQMHDILVQGLGFVAFAVMMIAFQIKDPRKTLFLIAPGVFLYALQYMLLGSIAAGLVFCSSALRDLLAAFAPSKIVKAYTALHIVLALIILYLFGHNWQEILVFLATLFSCFAVVQRNHFYRFRFLLLGRQASMLVFALWAGSIANALNSLIMAASNLVGIYRFYRNPTLVHDCEIIP